MRSKGETPLCDALRAYAAGNPLRGHMPGHKGKGLPLAELSPLSALDVTELTPTGDLFAGGGAIEAAERLWADAFRLSSCLFLTGGSTQGLYAALTLAAKPGETILLDRASHRAAYHALALLGLNPVYLSRPWLARPALPGPIDPQEVERQLAARPDIRAVCLTSPSYYGVLSDLPAIAAVTRRHGAILVVDAAHGAHLPFLGQRAFSCADLLVTSAHKTLPAMGQAALLFSGDGFSHRDLRRAGSLYGSASPSYPIMASLDSARAYLEGEGVSAYRETARLVAALRERLPALTEAAAALDPCRLTVLCRDGLALRQTMEAQNIFPELATPAQVVFILTCADGAEAAARLGECLAPLLAEEPVTPPPLIPPPSPEVVLSPRAALFSTAERLPLARCIGRISAASLAPYPPGIPIVAPGERITKKTIAYLSRIGYNMREEIELVPGTAGELPE